MPTAQATFPPGTILQGHYVIEGVLASGNADPVYQVRDQHTQRLFALKELMSSGERDGNGVTFETTAFKKRFVHPALPQVYDVFHNDNSGRLSVVLEYIEGSSLEEARHLQPEQRYSLSQAMSFMSPIMEAVIYLHSQAPPLFHGNIKPSHIIIESAGASTVLVNFDLAMEKDAQHSITIDPHATSGYEAPEQFAGAISSGGDIYALGATLYTLLTGRVPVDALRRWKKLSKHEPDPLVPLLQLAPAVPESVCEMIDRAMSMSSDERFSTVEQFWEALQQAANTSPVEQQITESAATPNEGNTKLESYSLAQLEPSTGIKDASMLANDPRVDQSQNPATISSDSSHIPIFSGAVNSRVTKPLQELPQIHPFKQHGALVLTLLALLVTLLASVGVGASLWHYIGYNGFYPTTSTSAPPLKATPSSRPTSTVVPTPSISSTNIAALYHGTIYDVSTNTTTKMSLTGIQQTQMTIGGDFTGLNRTGTFNGTIDPHPPEQIQFRVKDSAGHLILSFDGHMQSDGELSGSYCTIGQNAQCAGEYGLWSVAPAS
jgi:eukaryotic-like serine/threonine-protein kinase